MPFFIYCLAIVLNTSISGLLVIICGSCFAKTWTFVVEVVAKKRRYADNPPATSMLRIEVTSRIFASRMRRRWLSCLVMSSIRLITLYLFVTVVGFISDRVYYRMLIH